MGTEGPYCGMTNSHQNEQAQSACTNSTCSKQATYHCVHGKNMYACTHKRWYKDSRKGLEGWASNQCCGCLWGGEWPQGTRSQKTQALSMVFEVLQWECLYVAYLLFKEKQCYVKWWTRDALKQRHTSLSADPEQRGLKHAPMRECLFCFQGSYQFTQHSLLLHKGRKQPSWCTYCVLGSVVSTSQASLLRPPPKPHGVNTVRC